MENFTERREEERFDCSSVPLSIQLANMNDVYPAEALNCSEEGIAFAIDHELNVEAIVFIRKIACSESDESEAGCPFSRLSGFATIKWVQKNTEKGAGAYLAGARNFAYGSFY